MTADETPGFDLSGPCAECETPSADCDPHGIGDVCCQGCAATGGCTHQPPFDNADTLSAPSKERQSDVIEQAARAIWEVDNMDMTPEWRDMAWDDMGGGEPTVERGEYILAARALADAGLLAVCRDGERWPDDADQWDGDAWQRMANYQRGRTRVHARRAERAEAEVARLNTVVDRLSMARVNQADAETEAAEAVCAQLAAEAERDKLAAQVERVRKLADRLDSPYSNPSVRYMSTRIREALDGCAR